MKKYILECIGTAVLVLFGCGTAVLTNADPVATSLAFGLAIVAMAYSIGPVTGCHVNPAVSLAMLLSGKLKPKDFVGYVVGQFVGGFAGAGVLYAILKHSSHAITLGTNSFGTGSAIELSLFGALLVEVILTFVFVYVILGVTSDESKGNVAGLVIGLTLCFVHLIGIRLTGTSVNPARSLGPAIFTGGEALKQVWVFVAAPLLGSVLASVAFQYLNVEKPKRAKPVEHTGKAKKKA